jgi:SAM-dependent methyltransferase
MNLQKYEETVDNFLYMQWLRPENIPWDVAAFELIAPRLRRKIRMCDIGIGNGYTTFTYLGGKFKREYDWYFNTDVSGFWNNADIYDAKSETNIGDYIERYPNQRLALCVDHKSKLIEQAKELNISDKYVVADANNPMDLSQIDLVFSNALYWLRDPAAVLTYLHKGIKAGGELIFVCPNSDYFKYCRSYNRDTRMWSLLNRGRADSIMWSMDLDQLVRMVTREIGFELQAATRYCSRQTLKIWDIGLRPFSPYLIKMANGLDKKARFEIKQEWCEGLKPILFELLEEELGKGPNEGGYNFVHLRKPQ